MKKLQISLLVILALAAAVYAGSHENLGPYVDNVQGFPILYISELESVGLNLEDYFKGYNLQYSLTGAPAWATLSQRFTRVSNSSASKGVSTKSYKISRDLNGAFGDQLIVLDTQRTLSVHSLSGSSSSPTLQFAKQVGDVNTTCFDLSFFLPGWAIVDCQNTVTQANTFYVVSTTDSTVEPTTIVNQQIFPTNTPTGRHLRLLQVDSTHTYLLRASAWSEMTTGLENNTYIQVFRVVGNSLAYIRVIDRAALNTSALYLQDYQVRNGEIFLATNTSVFRIKLVGDNLNYTRYDTGLDASYINLYSDVRTGLLLVIATGNELYEINWDSWLNPGQVNRLSSIVNDNVVRTEFNDRYIVSQSEDKENVNGTSIYYINVYDKKYKLLSEVYSVYNYHGAKNVHFAFDQVSNNVLIITPDGAENYQIGVSSLFVAPPKNSTSSLELTITALSQEPALSQNSSKTVKLVVNVKPESDSGIYNVTQNSPSAIVEYPGDFELLLDNFFQGPALNYTIVVPQNASSAHETPKKKEENKKKFLSTLETVIVVHDDTFRNDSNTTNGSNGSNTTNGSNGSNTTNGSNGSNTSNGSTDDLNARINKVNRTNFNFSLLNVSLSDVIYVDALNDETLKNSFLWLIQLKDFSLNNYKCTYLDLESLPNCSKTNSTTAKSQVQKMVTFPYNNVLHYIVQYKDTNTTLDWYNALTLDHVTSFSSNIGSKSFEREIFDFAVDGLMIYLVHAIPKSIEVVSFGLPPSSVAVLTESTFSNLGVHYFAPRKVSTHASHSGVAFISNRDSLLVVDLADLANPILYKQIFSAATNQTGLNLYKTVITATGAVILADNSSIIEEWSLVNLETIYKRKEYPLYNYTLNLDSFASSSNGLFYVPAKCPKNNTFILIFRAGQVAGNALYWVEPVSGEAPLLRVAGSGSDFLTVLDNQTKISLYQVYPKPTIFFSALFNSSQFNRTESVNVTITVTNWFNATNQTFNFNLTSWNTNVFISPVTKSNVSLDSLFYVNSNQHDFNFNPHDVFQGAITNYTINCTDCYKKIQVASPLSLQSQVFTGGAFHDATFQGQKGYAQNNNRLFVLDSASLNITDIVDFPISDEHVCSKIAVHESQLYSFSLCISPEGKTTFYAVSYASSQPFVAGVIDISLGNIRKIEFFGDLLFVLAGPEDYLSAQSAIYIYKVDFNTEKILNYGDVIDILDMGTDNLYISGFTILKAETSDKLRVFVSAAKFGLRVVEIGINDVKVHTHWDHSLYPYVAAEGGSNSVIFNGVSGEEHVNSTASSQNYTLIVTTKNFHSYEFIWNYGTTSKQVTLSKVRIYVKYGIYETLNKVQTVGGFNGLVVIPYVLPENTYGNTTNFTKQVLAVYDRQYQNTSFLSLKDDNSDLRNCIGGFLINSTSTNYLLTANTNNTQTDTFRVFLANPATNAFEALNLRRNLTLSLNDTSVSVGDFDLIASNDYGSQKVKIRVNYPGGDDSGSKLWIIGVVIGVIVVLILIVVAVKKFGKKNQKSDPLLGNN